MSTINTIPMNHSAIMKIYAERDEIDLSPEYQRKGNIWSLEKKQLLIDSILNNYDIPKIYFHELKHDNYLYSVIDGRQRLETIWEFMDGKFSLADDFKYFKDECLNLKSLKYNDLAKEFPKLGNGTVAPAPPISINLSYQPKAPSIAPSTTNTTNILPGVNFVTSINI